MLPQVSEQELLFLCHTFQSGAVSCLLRVQGATAAADGRPGSDRKVLVAGPLLGSCARSTLPWGTATHACR